MNLAKFFSDTTYIAFEPNEIKTKKIKQFLDYIHGDINLSMFDTSWDLE